MNNKIFNIKNGGLFITIVLIFTIGYFLFNQNFRNNDIQNEVIPNREVENSIPIGKPVFTWDLKPVEDAGYPKTVVGISAKYENDVVITKEVSTADGSCNVYDNRDSDVYEQSEMIICYAAGLGNYYKVVESEKGYEVQQKVFEEALPDYNPPVKSFETIVVF